MMLHSKGQIYFLFITSALTFSMIFGRRPISVDAIFVASLILLWVLARSLI